VMYTIVSSDEAPIPDDVSPELRDFLTACFQKNPEDRPTADMLFEHDWLKTKWGEHKVS